MSAHLVSEKNIHALVNYGSRREYGSIPKYWFGEWKEINPQSAGQILWNENNRSVNFRYDEQEPDPVYTFRPAPFQNYTAVQIIKACDCLDYQSCETDDWKNTEAYAILHMIRERAIHALPGYEEAAWGID